MNARHLVALVLVAAGGVALAMHAGRSLVAERDAALAAAAAADANARIWQAKYAEQSTHVERAVDTVRVRTVRYDTLRSVITEHLTDTVEVLILPLGGALQVSNHAGRALWGIREDGILLGPDSLPAGGLCLAVAEGGRPHVARDPAGGGRPTPGRRGPYKVEPASLVGNLPPTPDRAKGVGRLVD